LLFATLIPVVVANPTRKVVSVWLQRSAPLKMDALNAAADWACVPAVPIEARTVSTMPPSMPLRTASEPTAPDTTQSLRMGEVWPEAFWASRTSQRLLVQLSAVEQLFGVPAIQSEPVCPTATVPVA
jgi:hypothetical protein